MDWHERDSEFEGTLTDREFLAWAQIPENRKYLDALYLRVLNMEDAPEELREQARLALEKKQEVKQLEAAFSKMRLLAAIIDQPDDKLSDAEILCQANSLMDEVTDAFLETPEPHRTTFLKALLPIRERLRSLQPDT